MSLGKPSRVKPPQLQPRVTTEQIPESAARAGEAESRLLRGRRTRTRFTPGFLRPASVTRQELKTTLG